MNENKKIRLLAYGDAKKVAEKFGVSTQTVRHALMGESSSYTARQIRAYVLQEIPHVVYL